SHSPLPPKTSSRHRARSDWDAAGALVYAFRLRTRSSRCPTPSGERFMANESSGVQLAAFGVTNVGMVRQNNEDAFVIVDLETDETGDGNWLEPRAVGRRGALLAVSDGMGGAAAGEIASAMTVESLKNWLHADHAVGTQALFEGAVGEANRSVYDAAQSAERRGMGATLTAVL